MGTHSAGLAAECLTFTYDWLSSITLHRYTDSLVQAIAPKFNSWSTSTNLTEG